MEWCLLVKQKLAVSSYRECLPEEVYSNSIRREVFSIAKHLGDELDNPDIPRFVARWWHACDEKLLINPLHYTIKTHKPQGNISIRVLHNAGSSPLGGIQHVVRQALNKHNKSISCVSPHGMSLMPLVLWRCPPTTDS